MPVRQADDTTLQSKRDRARSLIGALLAKTVANGCTENEAAKAAAKAAELMAAYNVSYTDAQQVREDVYGARTRQYGRTARLHELTDLWSYVAELTDTECYFSGGSIIFFGQKHDTEIAHYLLEMFVNVGETAWQAFRKAGNGETSIQGRKAFFRGMKGRLVERIQELVKQRRRAEEAATRRTSTGTSLVVVKQAVVAERYKQHATAIGGLHCTGCSSRSMGQGAGNYGAGRKAGDSVTITTGVASKASPRPLGAE